MELGRKGFTLIELLVVISILIMLLGVGSLRFRDFSRRQSLEAAVRSVKTDLRLAQGWATVGKKPESATECDTSSGASLNGYEVVYVNQSSYQINADCSGGIVSNIKAGVLPTGVIFKSAFAPVTFYSTTLGTDLISNLSLTLEFTGAGISDRVITITPQGEIR